MKSKRFARGGSTVRWVTLVAAGFFSCMPGVVDEVGARSVPLLTGVGMQAAALPGERPTKKRRRPVRVAVDYLAGAHSPSGAEAIELNLFTDAVFTAVKQRFERRDARHFTWFGKVQDDPQSMVVLVAGNGLVHGTIFAHGKYYEIRGGGAGQEVVEIDQSAFPREACDQPRAGAAATPPDAPDVQPDRALDDGSVIDVLVVYTPAARVATGGSAAIQNLAQAAVDVANASYGYSGVAPRLALTYTDEIAYTETGNVYLDLDRLQGTSDGYMDTVHALRDAYRADIVVLLIDEHAICGLANQMETVSTSFASEAFALVDYTCASANLTLGHEIGHIQGARHDRYVDNLDGFPFAYNHGTVDLASRQRTVMAYNDKCEALLPSPDNFCTRVPYWSNPGVNYPYNLSFPDPTPNPTGSGTEDNRLALNNTASTVANFRTASRGMPDFTWTIQQLADLNGDLRGDILWRKTGAGADYGAMYLWMMDGTDRIGATYLEPISMAWKIQGSRDFTGDGMDDILWREDGTGALYLWIMNGAATTTGTGYLLGTPYGMPDATWQIQGLGDLNGDGRSDILWRKTGAGADYGAMYLWMMDGTDRIGATYLEPISMAWKVQGVGDLNGDGKDDVLWREDGTGALYLWVMNGAATTTGTGYLLGTPYGMPDFTWTIQGLGDLNGDGRSDIVWRKTGPGPDYGAMYLWMMDGTNRISSSYLDPISMNWKVQGIKDFNADGKDDILWREDGTAELYLWIMNGASTGPGTGYLLQ